MHRLWHDLGQALFRRLFLDGGRADRRPGRIATAAFFHLWSGHAFAAWQEAS